MEVNIVKVGYLETNCYILKKDTCIIIDPGDESDKIKKEIGNYKVSAILITHNHFDHIGCLEELKSFYNCKVYDYSNLEEKEYNIDNFLFKVIYTKGHSNDSVTFYFKKENIMFVGDFIFKNSIGRTDLETGNYNEMVKSINIIKKYDKDIIIYPGHGDSTILGNEIKYNFYFNN